MVTGGYGFIGASLVESLLRDDHIVCVVDKSDPSNRIKQLLTHNRLHTHQNNILDTEKMCHIFSDFQPEVVFHLAAIHYIPYCEKYPDETYLVNVKGTKSILKASASCKNVKRFVFASSGAVYGDTDKELDEDSSDVSINDVYSHSKILCENLVESYSVRHLFESCIVRIFNTIGPHDSNRHVIPEIVGQLRKGNKTIELGNVNSIRTYVHVCDVADAMKKILHYRQRSSCEVFNIASKESYSVKEIIELFSQLISVDLNISIDPFKMRKQDKKVQKASISKVESKLKWTPKYTVQGALIDILQDILW